MPTFETIRPVRHSAEDMFALVADVEKYPEFLPMCEGLTVRERRARDDQTMILADMRVGYKAINETFTSQVFLKPQSHEIRARYVDGPFRSLDNRWTFKPTSATSCDVVFFIDYEFKSRVLSMVMGTMFDRAFRKFAEAFETRADQVYGVTQLENQG